MRTWEMKQIPRSTQRQRKELTTLLPHLQLLFRGAVLGTVSLCGEEHGACWYCMGMTHNPRTALISGQY